MKLRKASARENLVQLVARSFTEPARFIQKMHQRFFSDLSNISFRNCKNHEASLKDLYWNLHLVISSMLGTFAQHRRMSDFSNGICDENDIEDLSRRLIDFVSTGFEAGINSSSE